MIDGLKVKNIKFNAHFFLFLYTTQQNITHTFTGVINVDNEINSTTTGSFFADKVFEENLFYSIKKYEKKRVYLSN